MVGGEWLAKSGEGGPGGDRKRPVSDRPLRPEGIRSAEGQAPKVGCCRFFGSTRAAGDGAPAPTNACSPPRQAPDERCGSRATGLLRGCLTLDAWPAGPQVGVRHAAAGASGLEPTFEGPLAFP